jgi:serine protease
MNLLPACALRSAVLLMVALVMLGCGGGGGGGRDVTTPPGVPPAPPQAVISASPGQGTAPLTVLFDARSSTSGRTIEAYHWTFGSGTDPAVGPTVSHTFVDPGTFTVALTITDELGRTDRREHTISVSAPTGTYSVSGRIRILASSAVDSDVNDPAMPPVSNNSFAEAQPLPNPVTLGGFINLPGTGDPQGNLFTTGDPGDFYHIDLSGQDAILLTVGDPQSASLAMYLYRDEPQPVLVDSVMITGDAGLLRPPSPGSYYIEVSANDGASNYTLRVGQEAVLTSPLVVPPGSTSLLTMPSPVLSDEFVPGEFIVLDDVDASARRGADVRPRLVQLYPGKAPGGIGPPIPHGPSGRPQVLDRERIRAQLRERARGLNDGARVSPHKLAKLETLAAIQRFNQDNWRAQGRGVAEPNYIRRSLLAPNDPFAELQWHYPNIELPAAWEITRGSSDVIVAVIDTGVLLNHPDLRNVSGSPQKLVGGFNFISDPNRSRTTGGIGPDPDDPGDLAYGSSSSFHGTHVAGTIGARTNNAVGVAGVSWHARIMPVRALGVGGGTTYDVLQAVRYAAGLSNDSGTVPPQHAHIINMSLGSPSSSLSEQNVMRTVRERGIFIVASAGNNASSKPIFPAAYPDVISVSATTISRTLAPYSNFGPTIALAAPGGNLQTDLNADGIGDGVISTIGDDSSGAIRFGYAALMGTSMAAPHVSGVIALMKAVYPDLAPDQFDTLLQSGAITDALGTPGRNDEFGWGLINARKAVLAALALADGDSDVGPLLTGTPNTFNLGAFETEFPVLLRNVGGGTLSIEAIVSAEPWLDVVPEEVDSHGLGTYVVRVDRTQLPDDGTFLGSVRFESTANDVSVSVVLQRSELDFQADAGLHYVVLVEVGRNETVAGTMVSAANGEYAFTITHVPAGQYRLFAGSDLDNDGFICDAGEACGAYRTLDSPEIISVNRSLSNLDFVSGFRTNLFSPSADGERQGLQVIELRQAPIAKPSAMSPPAAKQLAD